jgi:hypothetical protein
MSGPLDTIDWRDPADTRAGAAPADTRPQPSLWSQVAAAARVEADRVDDVQTSHRWEAYEPLVNALVERGVPRKSLFDSPQLFGVDLGGEVPNWERIWQAAKRAGVPGLPGTQAEYDTQAFRRMGGRDADQALLARGSGAAAIGAQFLGGVAGSFADPVNLYTLPLGGGGKTIATRILSEGLFNAGVEAAQASGNAQALGRMGEDYTVADFAQEVGLAFAGGAAIRGGIEFAPKIDAAAYKALAPLRERMPGGTVSERDFARAFTRSVPADLRTPDQQAALYVLMRGAEVNEASPYVGTHSGFDTHAAKLAEAMDDIEAGRLPVERPSATPAVSGGATPETRSVAAPRANTGGKLHGGIVDFFVRNGLTEAQARGIAAGIHAESGSDPAALNEASGAFGLGQWLGPRKRAIVERYGPHPTMEQQLEFLLWELRGGDHGGRAVLAKGDEAGVLRSYIEDFMRPAKGAETTGDLRRGMDALGRGSEDLPLGGAGDAGELDDSGLGAAIAAEEADLAGRRAALDDAPDVRAISDDGAAEPAIGTPALDPDTLQAGLVDVLRPIVREGGRSLNQVGKLAGELGVSEQDLRGALDRLVGTGELAVTKAGHYRRKAIGSNGEADLVRFVARNGGLSYDGLGEAYRAYFIRENGYAPPGHDLKNTGYLDKFVPGIGPLLRPRGKSLDEMGELAWEAGYFGPVETTPRPTERELMDLLGELTRTGQKRMPGGATGETPKAAAMPDGRAPLRPDLFQGEAHYEHEKARYDAAAQRVLGRPLSDEEFVDAFGVREGLPRPDALDLDELAEADIHAMVNRRLEEALDDAFLEAEEDFYDLQAWELDNAAAGEDPAGGARGEGQAADARDAGEGGGGGEAGPRAAGSAELDQREAEGLNGPDIPETKAQAARFDSDAGDGVQAIAESDWHDIRAGIERERTVALPEGETRGQGVQYHGARGDLPDLTEGYYNADNIYGGFETFYTTDAADIAGGYQRKRAAGKIYRADEVAPVNTFDMEERLPVEDIARLFGIADWQAADGFPASSIEAAIGADGKLNLREAMDEIRLDSASEGYTKDDVQGIFDAAIYNLQQQGFGAMRHIGGLQTGRTPHNVKIYFDAPNQLRLTATEKAQAPALDAGAATNPAIAERQRQEAQLRAEAPMRAKSEQDGTMGAPLFDAADQPKFDLEDGKGPRTAAEIDAEIAADRAAIEEIRACLK